MDLSKNALMNNSIRFLFILVWILIFNISLEAQEKSEWEYRTKQSYVPVQASEWVSSTFTGIEKVKWYNEVTSGKTSVEAKLKWKGSEYSIEFDTTGIIEDVEQKCNWKEIEKNARQKIESYFISTYKKHRIIKVQKQFIGAPGNLRNLILNNENNGITLNYEIEFHGKTETENELWEGLFNSKGELLQLNKIKLNPTNNLEF